MISHQNSKNKPPCLLMVYTGNGKGKTTAAVGQAVRALGHGYRVYIIHFLKGRDYGEYLAAEHLPGLTVEKAGRDAFVNRENPDPVDIEMVRNGWERASQAVKNGDYDLVVMDELNVVLDFGLLDPEEVCSKLSRQHRFCDVITTGRNAPREIVDMADLVSEIKEIKHHYQEGITSRRGIEY